MACANALVPQQGMAHLHARNSLRLLLVRARATYVHNAFIAKIVSTNAERCNVPFTCKTSAIIEAPAMRKNRQQTKKQN